MIKDINALREAMKTNVVKFSFNKKDGTIREALGTRSKEFIPPANKETTREYTHNDSIFVYFDVDRNGWRSFRKDSYIENSGAIVER